MRRRPVGTLLVLLAALGCKTLEEGSAIGATESTSSTSDTMPSTSVSTSLTTSTSAATDTSNSETTESTSGSESGETTTPVLTTDSSSTTDPMPTTSGDSSSSSSSSSSSESSSSGPSECDVFDDNCGDCIDTLCCGDLEACEQSTQCGNFVDCMLGGTTTSECAEMHEHPSLGAILGCVEENCAKDCDFGG